jgi:predicted metalloprotease with PDZ domain
LLALAVASPTAQRQTRQTTTGIVYTMRFPSLEGHLAEIDVSFPSAGRPTLDLTLPTWSPGYYGAGNYARSIQEFTATSASGAALTVEKPQDNHWRIATGGAAEIRVHYRLLCQSTFVTGSWVGPDFAVINGPSTFITIDDGSGPRQKAAYEVRLDVPAIWPQVATSLNPVGGQPHSYGADNYDLFIDSPIILGKIEEHSWDVPGTHFTLADFGDVGSWNGAHAAASLQRIVDEHRRMLGGRLPFDHYVFLNAFRRGAGGLEHSNSSLLSSGPAPKDPEATIRWLNYVSHEFFHAINVKRLRPVELGPFDYEHVPRTPSLWISEGLTTYYGDLAVARSGVGTEKDFLADISGLIKNVQTSPGHLVQTLQDASLDVGRSGGSGVGGNRQATVSYYDKGPIVGLLLDAKIRRASNGARSFDDVMRLEVKRWSGEHGFTPEEFQSTAAEASRMDLKAFFHSTLETVDELDYTEMLDWFGLRFASTEAGGPNAWSLEVRPEATAAQKAHLAALLAPSK